jgi:iron complex outermembrane receptor protein
MHLLTLQYLTKWERSINEKNRLIISNLGSFERNTNFGARKIVPDASMLEANASVFVETSIRKTALLENGLSAGVKRIHTFETPSVNSAEKEIRPFMKNAVYYNAFSGITFFPDEELNIKFNASTGVRIPNLAELSSNGLHEGVFTYEVGDPTLKNEQSLGLNAQATFGLGSVEWEVSPFYNAFRNFVYLAPTEEGWYGFPVYRYLQQDAYQYGGESKLSLKLNASFSFSTAYSGMIGKTADGNALPFTPPQKITPAVSFHRGLKNSSTLHAYVNMDVLCAQLQVAPQEIATPAYQLLNAGMSMEGRAAGRNWMMSLACNNLLNQAYYDHMSRFKYFGLLNMGRNLTLQVRITLNKEKQTD